MVDGIGPIPGSMFGPLGLEVDDLKNSQFDWKTVSKGKRSRKSVVRNSNGLSKLPSESPVRVVDFSGSDSEKYVEASVWPHSSNDSLCVPLKKRRHILWAPSPPPSHASLPNAVQLPPQHQPPSDDFSGIALLAATACNDNTEEPENAKGGDMEPLSSILGRCHTFVSSMQLGDSVSCSGQKDVLHLDDKKRQCFPEASYVDQIGGDDDIPNGATNFGSSEVDTLHRDLYTLMKACKENEASSDCIPKEQIHRNEDYASTDFNCKSNVNDVKHMPLGPSNDGGSSLGCTILKYSEHQLGMLEVTGLEKSEPKNGIQMKEEECFQKAFELPENGITFGEGMIRETSNTVVETSGTRSEGIVTSDKGLISDTEVGTVCNLQESIKTHVYDDGSNKLDADENEDRVQLDSTQNNYELQMDYDSPYEDGELRRSVLHSNEEEDGEHDCADYEVNGRVGGDLDSAHYPGPEGSQATEESLGINKELEDSIENIETEGNNVPIRVDELTSPMVVEKHDSSGKRKCPFDIAVSRMEDIGSKVISEKWKSCTEGWHTSGRFGKVDISRENSPDRHATGITRYGSSLHKHRQTEGNRLLNYPDSRHGDHIRSRGNVHRPPTYQIGDSIGRSQENYQPEGIRQPFSRRRSPVKRFDFRGANTKVANIRSNRRERSPENCSGGYLREENDQLVVDDDVERSAYTRRVDRMRGSFQKPKFSAGYEEELVSSPRGQFLRTPPHGNRFVRETIFLTQPTRHQKSPRDMFRQDQKLSDTRTLSRRFPVVSSRDELDEHCNNGRRTSGMRYSDIRHSRFEDGHCDTRKEDYYRRGQRNFAGGYRESSLSPSSHRSGWANESSFVRSPSRYTRSPMGGAFRQQTERLVGGPVGLSGQRKSKDYLTTGKTTRYVE